MQVLDQLVLLFVHMALVILIVFYVIGSLRDFYEMDVVPSGFETVLGPTNPTPPMWAPGRTARIARYSTEKSRSVRVNLTNYLTKAKVTLWTIVIVNSIVVCVYYGAFFGAGYLPGGKIISDFLGYASSAIFWVSNGFLVWIAMTGFSQKINGLAERYNYVDPPRTVSYLRTD